MPTRLIHPGFMRARRRLLLRSLGLLAWLPAGQLPARSVVNGPPSGSHPPAPAALTAYLDTLLPEDTTPSASRLGVDQAMIALTHQQPKAARLVTLGCAWLEQQAKARGGDRFADLPEAAREAVVAVAAASPKSSLPGAFFAFTQREAFTLYYAQPAAWTGLGYAGPPQPAGFLDFAQPPATSSG